MITKAIPFILLLFAGNIILAQTTRFDLYLLIGQSNMAGRGAVVAEDSVVHKRVFSLNKENRWVPAQDPIHFDKKVAGVGLGRTFGIEMAAADTNAVIGLIPCAVGGSPIDVWKPGGYHKQTDSHPWDDMEKRLKLALEKGELKGILWHQGESDSNPEKCHEYKIKLEDLMFRVRELAGNQNIPFVAGELGRFKYKDNKNKHAGVKPSPAKVVVKSTRQLVREDKNAAFVKSKGLTHLGDNTHFNTESYRKFGKRYAQAMKKLQR